MYMIFSDTVRSLSHEVKPWIVGRKSGEEDFAPIFKDNTPPEIIEKYNKMIELIEQEYNTSM